MGYPDTNQIINQTDFSNQQSLEQADNGYNIIGEEVNLMNGIKLNRSKIISGVWLNN